MRQHDVKSNIRCYQIIAHNGISDIKFRTQNQAQERRSQRINLDFELMKIYYLTIFLEVLQNTLYDFCYSDTSKEGKKLLKSYDSIEIKFHLPA